ncbi:MAG: hypothetical protein AAF850_05115 [Pseudomonadota bacterium]
MKPTPLLVIGGIFAASFLARGLEVAAAAAESTEEPSVEKPSVTDKHADDSHAAPTDSMGKKASADGASDHGSEKMADAEHMPKMAMDEAFCDREPSELLVEIRERSMRVNAREAEIAQRATALKAIEERVNARIELLRETKADLEDRLNFADAQAKEDIERLARMYENMKPARAGEIFNAMEPSFAAGFLTEMASESAAQILTNMETEKAYAASIIIAGRNAKVNIE